MIKIHGKKNEIVSSVILDLYKQVGGIYFEPFVGSGFVLRYVNPSSFCAADTNPFIISLLDQIDSGDLTKEKLVSGLIYHRDQFILLGESYYKDLRDAMTPDDPISFIAVSRASFNGLMRFNSRGKFNTPFCKRENPLGDDVISSILMDFMEWKRRMARPHVIKLASYEQTLDLALDMSKLGSQPFVYCDPPYDGTETTYYTKWKKNFTSMLHEALVYVGDRGVKFACSTGAVDGRPSELLDMFSSDNVVVIRKSVDEIFRQKSRKKREEIVITNVGVQ